jgi:iron complex transport system permease protein
MQQMQTSTNNQEVAPISRKVIVLLIALPVVLFLFSLVIGRYQVSLADCVKILLSTFLPVDRTWSDTDAVVV